MKLQRATYPSHNWLTPSRWSTHCGKPKHMLDNHTLKSTVGPARYTCRRNHTGSQMYDLGGGGVTKMNVVVRTFDDVLCAMYRRRRRSIAMKRGRGGEGRCRASESWWMMVPGWCCPQQKAGRKKLFLSTFEVAREHVAQLAYTIYVQYL